VTGFIGRTLATRALEAGHSVVGFSRRAWSGAPYVPLCDRYLLELPSQPEIATLSGVDVVVHLAIAPQGGDPRLIDAVNRVGTLRLYETARNAGVGRFIFLSSQSAHEGVTSAYGQSKFAVEQALGAEPDVLIVRPAMVYGDSDDGLMGRATKTAARLRVFPVIGGDRARAQPVHVLHVADTILAVAGADDPPRLIRLGDPPVPLGDMIRSQARERHGVTPLAISVPLGLARTGVRFAGKLHLPSPISEANLDGIEAFEPMDTTSDEALARELIDHSVREAVEVEPVEPRRLILIGAGRVGLVHALTAAHHPDMQLVGIVDLDRAAMARLASFAGPTLPRFTDLHEAIAALRPDAAIVATPPASHVPLAKQLLGAGIDVLLEKPVSATVADREMLVATLAEHSDRYLTTGYLAGVLPHLLALAPDLRSGRFGRPTGFHGHAFVTRVEEGVAEQREMWELDPKVSGGGALVNLGVHVLAMIDLLLGPVSVERAVLVRAESRFTEDAATLHLSAGGVKGTFSTAWQLPGFDMPENSLRIDTDAGFVVCTTACAAYVGSNEVRVVHQIDADLGFDLAPLDAGGGFWYEQHLLAGRTSGLNSIELAGRTEDLISRVYASADRIQLRAGSPPRSTQANASPAETGVCVPDLRGAPPGIESAWSATALVGSDSSPTNENIVALPDAPGHFRTLTNAGALTLARSLGITNLGVAAFGVSPLRAASHAGRPWEALLVLLRAEARRLSHSYRGTLVVDAYLVDLATATGHVDALRAAIDDLRSRCPQARVGIEANAVSRLIPHAPLLGSQIDMVIALGSADPGRLVPLNELLPSTVEVVTKTGPLPRELLEVAWDDPERWTHGRGRLVVHWPGAPGLRAAHEASLQYALRAAGHDIA
jgi:predicted dehydrogenase/nucleoside-diphosphate-sugar epimerase